MAQIGKKPSPPPLTNQLLKLWLLHASSVAYVESLHRCLKMCKDNVFMPLKEGSEDSDIVSALGKFAGIRETTLIHMKDRGVCNDSLNSIVL